LIIAPEICWGVFSVESMGSSSGRNCSQYLTHAGHAETISGFLSGLFLELRIASVSSVIRISVPAPERNILSKPVFLSAALSSLSKSRLYFTPSSSARA